MKKIIFCILGIVGAGLAYWLISPLFITKRVQEKSPVVSTTTSPVEQKEVARGNFDGLAGHRAEGIVKLLTIGGKKFIRFEDDFSVTNGPDLFVYLGNNGVYDPNTRLGALKGNVGSQNYEIPSAVDVGNYNEVWVWCRAFSVPFGKAILQ
ncbi:MAG: DM13 domain-containing protein [Parcubacteria group bacterium]|nr:DM13 domain-containing protein [Parcubacteria group bacterium]